MRNLSALVTNEFVLLLEGWNVNMIIWNLEAESPNFTFLEPDPGHFE